MMYHDLFSFFADWEQKWLVEKFILVSDKRWETFGSAFRNFLALWCFFYVWESLCYVIGMYIMYYVSVSKKCRLVQLSVSKKLLVSKSVEYGVSVILKKLSITVVGLCSYN